jgi:arginyl-tRNA--protein-N-Asp/Glu arginylyltransferase
MRGSPFVLADHGDCPYLPDRHWVSALIQVQEASPPELHHLIEMGFRRVGNQFYSPLCEGCQACISLRIAVEQFKPNKNQRQIARRNQDLVMTVEPAVYRDEYFELYRRYQAARWKSQPEDLDRDRFQRSYYEQPGKAVNFCYREHGKLVGLSIVDVTPEAASSVYFVWDTDPRRSLGIYSVLQEIEWCRQTSRSHLYLGLYVEGCASMDYKTSFQPHQRRYRGQAWMDRPETGWPSWREGVSP